MNSTAPIAVAASIALALAILALPARAHAQETVPGEMIVTFRSRYAAALDRRQASRPSASLRRGRHSDTESAERRKIRARRARPVKRVAPHTYLVKTGARKTLVSGAIVSPNFIYRATALPNDEYFFLQWSLDDPLTDFDMNANEAWDITTGPLDSVVVGVIDTGVDYTHPDLAANMWRNPDEIPANGQDDDGNGYVDDVHGINAIDGSGDPMDDHFHGTHCAGTVGAVGNNAIGVAGVNWSVKLVALKFLNDQGSGTTANAVEAIEYFTDIVLRDNLRGITNNSWGGGGFDPALAVAIGRASDAGILFVAAAGNSARNNDNVPFFPANYNFPNVISVAAMDGDGTLASFSNFGASSVDIAAPGVDILSTIPGDYAFLSGTSMAAPHVAGAAALILGQATDMTVEELRTHILSHRKSGAALGGLMANPGIPDLAAALGDLDVTPTPTPTNTATFTATNTPANTPTNTPTPTGTNTPTNTPSPTPTNTHTATFTLSHTPTRTNTPDPSSTPTNAPTMTPTEIVPTFTFTPTRTPVPTPTDTLPAPPPGPGPVETPATSIPTPTASSTPRQNRPLGVTPGMVPEAPIVKVGRNRFGATVTVTFSQNFKRGVKYEVNLAYMDSGKEPRVRITNQRRIVFQAVQPGEMEITYTVRSNGRRSVESETSPPTIRTVRTRAGRS